MKKKFKIVNPEDIQLPPKKVGRSADPKNRSSAPLFDADFIKKHTKHST